MNIVRTDELILKVILLGIIIILQIIPFFLKKKENISKDLFEMKGDISKELTEVKGEINNELTREVGKLKLEMIEKIGEKFEKLFEVNTKNGETLNQSIKETLTELKGSIEGKLDKVTETLNNMTEKVDTKLQNIQRDNTEQLEKMRQVVDEKLQKTLNERLGESFKQVSERLELVHKGLGEMQNLATGVGDLKKVLSNVKTRGNLGEIQLEQILEQFLSPEQYDKNVKTKPESNDLVEFAIKLPGKEENKCVYIPVDAKFPLERYHQLMDSYDIGDPDGIKIASSELEKAIKKSAKDIRDKYISVPHTTDFGIMFLPIEGLYAEVVRSPELLEYVQKELKIMVAGPTTLVAMLNSLQMGFRTLAIEKRSSEVWDTLGKVKTEFEKFGAVLEKAQKKIREADQEIDNLVTTRTNKMKLSLKNVTEFDNSEE